MTGINLSTADASALASDAAALDAGVTVREVSSVAELNDIVRLLAEIWGRPENPPISAELLRAFSKAGNYISGAFDGDRMIGATIGFHSTPERLSLHSHIAGVTPGLTGRRVGYAMKLHQRAWALARGIGIIEWTYDPLVARNAYFNIAKLGALPVEYLTNFYGPMADAINGGDETDRLLVRWELTDADVASAAAVGRALPIDAHAPGRVLVPVPADIEGMRSHDPALAHEWRVVVRENLTGLLAAGGRIVGFDREGGYVVQTAGNEGNGR